MTVLIPGHARPNNLRFQGVAHVVESDVYNICERIREVDPDLFIVVADPPRPDGKNFIVMEIDQSGAESLVSRYEELDARIIEDVERMRKIPLPQRLEQLEKDNTKFERAEQERMEEELYERLGGPMWHQLEHDGFIDSRGVSAPKRGISYGKS